MPTSVPVIDFTAGQTVAVDGKWDITSDQRTLAKEMIEAFKTVGFICLVNTSIDEKKVNRVTCVSLT